MTDRIRAQFEAFAQQHGFSTQASFDRYKSTVVRWMALAWFSQAERINDLTTALQRATTRNAELVNQCRDHDTRRAAAVAQAAALADEVERLTELNNKLLAEGADAEEM